MIIQRFSRSRALRRETNFLGKTHLQPRNSDSDGPSRCLESFMVNLLTIKFMLLKWAQKQESRMHVIY